MLQLATRDCSTGDRYEAETVKSFMVSEQLPSRRHGRQLYAVLGSVTLFGPGTPPSCSFSPFLIPTDLHHANVRSLDSCCCPILAHLGGSPRLAPSRLLPCFLLLKTLVSPPPLPSAHSLLLTKTFATASLSSQLSRANAHLVRLVSHIVVLIYHRRKRRSPVRRKHSATYVRMRSDVRTAYHPAIDIASVSVTAKFKIGRCSSCISSHTIRIYTAAVDVVH